MLCPFLQNSLARSEDISEDIEALIPDAKDIFSDDQLSIITKDPSTAKTAIKIIRNRIRGTLISPVSDPGKKSMRHLISVGGSPFW
jgi:hypothetical protein